MSFRHIVSQCQSTLDGRFGAANYEDVDDVDDAHSDDEHDDDIAMFTL